MSHPSGSLSSVRGLANGANAAIVEAVPGWIGPWELAILLIVVLLVFGPKRLPEMGKSLGKGMREFKQSMSGLMDDDDKDTKKVAASSDDGK